MTEQRSGVRKVVAQPASAAEGVSARLSQRMPWLSGGAPIVTRWRRAGILLPLAVLFVVFVVSATVLARVTRTLWR